jgi:hypothetical protein
MRTASLLILTLSLLAVAACAGNPKDREPWHEWLHTQGLE